MRSDNNTQLQLSLALDARPSHSKAALLACLVVLCSRHLTHLRSHHGIATEHLIAVGKGCVAAYLLAHGIPDSDLADAIEALQAAAEH